eukprot:629578-Pyramimonas_sp.AAC.1
MQSRAGRVGFRWSSCASISRATCPRILVWAWVFEVLHRHPLAAADTRGLQLISDLRRPILLAGVQASAKQAI